MLTIERSNCKLFGGSISKSEQILIAVLGFIKNLLLLFVAGQLDAIDGSDNIDFDELVEIAERYDCPQPNESDKLVVGWDGYSRPMVH